MDEYKRCPDCNREMILIKEPEFMVWSCECGKEINYVKRDNGE